MSQHLRTLILLRFISHGRALTKSRLNAMTGESPELDDSLHYLVSIGCLTNKGQVYIMPDEIRELITRKSAELGNSRQNSAPGQTTP